MRGVLVGVLFGVILGVGGAALDTVFVLRTGRLSMEMLVVGAAWFLLNSGVVWGLLAFVAGRLSRRVGIAALAGVVSLVAAVGSYYGYGLTFGDRVWGLQPLVPVITRWMVAAVVLGAIVGLLGALSRRAGKVAYVGIATPVILALGALSLGWRDYGLNGTVIGANLFVVAACLLACGIMIWRRERIHSIGE